MMRQTDPNSQFLELFFVDFFLILAFPRNYNSWEAPIFEENRTENRRKQNFAETHLSCLVCPF